MLFTILMDGVQMRPDIFAAISPKLIARLRQLAKNTFNDGFKQNITNLQKQCGTDLRTIPQIDGTGPRAQK